MGFRLKQIRQLRKISQGELALALGVVTQTIQKYESGEVKIQPETIQRCAEVFKISIGYFYGEEASTKQFSRASLMIASEIMTLPNDKLRKGVFNLVRTINQEWVED